MNILKIASLLCLLGAPAFAAIYQVYYPHHVLRRRFVNLEQSDTPRFYVDRNAEFQESPRVARGLNLYADKNVKTQQSRRLARDLSPSVKDDLQNFFTIDHFLSMAQKFLRISLKITQTITGNIPAKSIKQAIEVLGFPGSKVISAIAEEIMTFINELTAEIAKSDFIAKNPTKENFWKMLTDTVYLGLKKGLRFNTLMLHGAKKAFTETQNTKYNLLDNVKVTHPLAKNFLENIHKFLGQLLRGLEKISSDKIKTTVVGFIKVVSLPFAKEFSEIIDIIIAGFNRVSTELLQTKFIKEAPDVKNVNQFIVAVFKATTIAILEDVDGILKILLSSIQKSRGLQVDLSVGKLPDVPFPDGFGTDIINEILEFFVNIDPQDVLKKIHKFVSFTARFVLDVTNDPGVKSVPDIIRAVGKQVTEVAANSASFIIGHAHSAAIEATNSKFVKENPSWENGKDFLLGSIKTGLKTAIEITNNMKQYFDSTVAAIIKVPNLVKEILQTIIPESALSNIQGHVKVVAKAIDTLTGIIPTNAIKAFITSSELPFKDELSATAMKIMTWVNGMAKLLAQSQFVSGKPNLENAVLAITEIIKLGISSGLGLFAEILKIIESLF